MIKYANLLVLVVIATFIVGCGGHSRGPYSPAGGQTRDVPRAAALYQEAMAKIAKDPEKAQELLRQSLDNDLYHGAAHNNLGVLLLGQGRLYDAAEEFEWARKLMPGNPEPRYNLALALDRGGKTGEAIEMARTALETMPGHLPSIQTLTLIQVREGLADDGTLEQLHSIAMRSPDKQWREWAVTQRLALEGRQSQR